MLILIPNPILCITPLIHHMLLVSYDEGIVFTPHLQALSILTRTFCKMTTSLYASHLHTASKQIFSKHLLFRYCVCIKDAVLNNYFGKSKKKKKNYHYEYCVTLEISEFKYTP